MTKKLTYEYVKSFIETKHPGSKLISSYINCMEPLVIICENGHNMNKSFNVIQRDVWCAECEGLKKLTYDYVKKFIESKHLGCKLISKTYEGHRKKLEIICSNGHKFSMLLANIQTDHWCRDCATELRKQTCLDRYGCEHPAQNNEIALKAVKNSKKTIIKFHWKTGEDLLCTGSYEQKVIDYLNNNKINFVWQPKPPFTLSTGNKYFIDLYLIDQNLYVEIKGYMRSHSLLKWMEFHETIHLNSELWDKKKLKEMKIL